MRMQLSTTQEVDDDKSMENEHTINQSEFLTSVMSIEPRLYDSDITIDEQLTIINEKLNQILSNSHFVLYLSFLRRLFSWDCEEVSSIFVKLDMMQTLTKFMTINEDIQDLSSIHNELTWIFSGILSSKSEEVIDYIMNKKYNLMNFFHEMLQFYEDGKVMNNYCSIIISQNSINQLQYIICTKKCLKHSDIIDANQLLFY